MTQEEIDSYLEQTDNISRTPYGPGNKRYNAKKEAQKKQQEYANLIRQGNANYNAPIAPIGNRFPTDSVYDEGITVYDLDNGLNTYRDKQQSGWAEAGNILLHGATSAATAFAGTAMLTNPYGLAAMAGATAIKAIENATDDNKENDNPFAWFADNAINKLLFNVNDAITSNTPVYSAAMDREGLGKYAGTGGLDQLVSGLGYLAGGWGSARYAASKLSKGSQFYDYILNKAGGDKILKGATLENAAVNGIQAAQDIDKIAKAKRLADGITGITSSLVARAGESVIEAQGTKQEMLNNGYTEEQADNALKYGFAANMALSSVDYFQNLKMFGTFKGILGTEAKAVRYADDIIAAAAKGGLGKYDKATQIIKSFGENFIQEGGEEGLQYAINKGAQDTAIQKEGMVGFIKNLGKEFGNSFVTEEGQLSWILGGILGGGAGARQGVKTAKARKGDLANYISEAKALKGDLDANYKLDENALYSTYRMPDNTIQKVINQKYIDTISNNNELETVKEYAQAKNDNALYESAKNKQVLNKALFALHTDTFDSFIGELETSKDITPEELTKLKALQDNTTAEETVTTDEDLIKHKKGIDKSITLAKEFKNLYNSALELPQLSRLTKDSMFNLFKLVSSQKALAAELQEANPLIMGAVEEYVKNPEAETNEALNSVLDSTSDPIEKEKLKDEYEKYKDLGLANKKFLEQYSKLMESPKKIQDATNQEDVAKTADLIKDTEEENRKEQDIANEAARKLEELKKTAEEPIVVTTDNGQIEAVMQDGVLVNAETGEPIEEELLSQFKKDVVDEEQIESEQTPEEYDDTTEPNTFLEGPKKRNTYSTSTRGLDINYTESSSGHYARDIDNLFQYVLYESHKLITKWFSIPKNTPSDSKKFTAKLTEEPITQQLLDDINIRRLSKNAQTGLYPQLTLEDLQSPKYKPLRMRLYENGKLVKESEDNIIHFHDVDYFYETQAYLNILNDENLDKNQKELAIAKEINKLTAERTELVNNLNVAVLIVNDKSDGVLNFLPNKNGIKRVLPISNLANQEGNYGIGYVKSIDEDGVAIIDYNGDDFDSGRKDLKLGALVFDIISAKGSHLVNNNITKNKYTPEQIDSIAELLIYKITSGTDSIKINDKSINIKELLRSLIYLGINKNNSESTIAFSKEGDILIVGRDKKIDGKYDNSSKWDKERAIKDRQGLKDSLIRLLSDNYHAYPNPDMKILNQKSNIIVFPTEINELGEAKGDIIPIQDFFLNGKEPMIGTNINPNIPFINSYFSFEINGAGLVFDVKEQQAEPYASNLEGEIPTDSDFGFEETKETTTPVTTDTKADIEKRRQEELNQLEKELNDLGIVIGENNLKETAEKILEDIQSPFIKQILKGLINLISKTGTKLNITKGNVGGMGVSYDHVTNTIQINLDTIIDGFNRNSKLRASGGRDGFILQTFDAGKGKATAISYLASQLLHETIHAFTTRQINNFEKNSKNELTQEEYDIIQNIQNIFNYIKSNKILQAEYGISDIHELLAELFSNETFADKLKNINLPKELQYKAKSKNLFEGIIDLISDLITKALKGFTKQSINNEETVFENISNLVNDLINAKYDAELRELDNNNFIVKTYDKQWKNNPSKSNKTTSFALKTKPNEIFELVKDEEEGFYSLHIKTSNKDSLTESEKQQLVKVVANNIPIGGKLSSWGEATKGGISGLNRFKNEGFEEEGTRKVSDNQSLPILVKKIDAELAALNTTDAKADIDLISTPVSKIVEELSKLNTLNEKLNWLKNNKLLSPININGKEYNTIDYSDRVMVLMKIGKYNIPFYISTGQAGKKNVKAGNWYAVFGIGVEKGWINKGSEEQINNNYGFQVFEKLSKILNEGIGVIQSREDNGNGKLKDGIGFLSDSKQDLEAFNNSMNLPTKPAGKNTDTKDFYDHVNSTLFLLNNELKELAALGTDTKANIEKWIDSQDITGNSLETMEKIVAKRNIDKYTFYQIIKNISDATKADGNKVVHVLKVFGDERTSQMSQTEKNILQQYDAELAALKEKEVTPEENKVNQQLKENEINCSNNGEGIKLNPKPKFNFKK
jgi:hypothetical protein